MNIILQKTHVKNNIRILKARDYYFNIAKKLNAVKTAAVLLPPIFLLATYIFSFVGIDLSFDGYGELISGTMATIVMLFVFIINIFIDKYTDISNRLRTLYDHLVLGTEKDPIGITDAEMQEYYKKSEKIKDAAKYETWYSEVFSDNSYANVFCCQMDNLIYAKHAYRRTRGYYLWWIIGFSVIAVSLSIIAMDWLKAILILFTVRECYSVFIEKIITLNNALEICDGYCDRMQSVKPSDLNEDLIRATQEIVNRNRSFNIFLPKRIRDYYLRDGNPFYQELNHYKNKFMGDNAVIPEKAEDIDVVYEDGSESLPLSEIHTRLANMLRRVIDVFDSCKITYALDGGTLIGAMRRSTKGFIPWDDDIDISIPIDQLSRAKAALREHLNYEIQDAENEPFYSPRLSAFKIREKNEDSRISEKDSMLYTDYKLQGLFIDVYAYSPILVSKAVDRMFRRLVIHPLNRKLERVENDCSLFSNREKRQNKFRKLKSRYMKILSFYRKNAKNARFYSYFPGYIYDYNKAGPYHKADELYCSEQPTATWEGQKYNIPNDHNAVLTAYYGDKWEISPFPTLEELKSEHKDNWFSQAPTKITSLKHIANILYYKK